MAKLEGVKTIDMVNGEITKVSYNYAEYEKATTGFAQAQTGDLFQSDGGMDETNGAFYEITIVENGDGHPIKFTDDAGDNNGYERRAPHLPLFRKISAQSTPTIEERVEELEAEVAKLKAESKQKINRKHGEFKKGDIVRLKNQTTAPFIEGTFGVVVRSCTDGYPLVKAVTDSGTHDMFFAYSVLVAPVESLV